VLLLGVQERILAAGGRLIWNNGLRVMGALGMSRALGDHLLQPHGVSAEPDVALLPRSGDEDFLLLATDGLWGAVSNEVGRGKGGMVCCGAQSGAKGSC
jgi:protein phosphatase 2C